jgi:N-acetyl-anhydromuramyl-L-alanine amidase AmpD
MTEKKEQITAEEARKILLEEQQKETQQVTSEIEEVLKKYGYEFRINNQIQVVKKQNG